MAEAAALTLAAIISKKMNFQQVNILSDNQQMVSFLNTANEATLPYWNIKFLTQEFLNHVPNQPLKVYKIPREMNSVAHNLASKALCSDHSQNACSIQCNNITHSLECPIKRALENLHCNWISYFAASCC